MHKIHLLETKTWRLSMTEIQKQDWSATQTQIGVRTNMTVTPHHFSDDKWCHILGITMAEDCGTFSGRSWIYGTSQHWQTGIMVLIHQQGDWFSTQRTITTMFGQSSSNFLNCKSYSWTLNQTYWHTTPLCSWTMWQWDSGTFSHPWGRQPYQFIHKTFTTNQSGKFEVQSWTCNGVVQLSGSVEMVWDNNQ